MPGLSTFSAVAGAVGGLGAICYAIGYLIALGWSLKLGLPVNLQESQVLIVRGATFPLGLVANAILASHQVLRGMSRWGLAGTVVVVVVALPIIGAVFRRAG